MITGVSEYEDVLIVLSDCTSFKKHRTIFIARQHTDARYWYSKSVRLSVRLSVTFQYQMKTA